MLRLFKTLRRDKRGAYTVELAFTVFILGVMTIAFVDLGRLALETNAAQKAVTTGARLAAERDPVVIPIKWHFRCIVSDANYDTVDSGLRCSADAAQTHTNSDGSTGYCNFGSFVCRENGCTGTETLASNSKYFHKATFDWVAAAMSNIYPRVQAKDISISYRPTNLGFVGMPTSAVAEVTVAIDPLPAPGVLSAFDVTLPQYRATITAEDLNDNSCADQQLKLQDGLCVKPNSENPGTDPFKATDHCF
jgi:hypothetical protein